MPILDRRLQAGQRIANAQTRLETRRQEEEERPSVVQIAAPNPISIVQPEVPTQPIEQQTLLQPAPASVVNPQPQQPQPQGGGVLGTISQLGSLAGGVKGLTSLFSSGVAGSAASAPIGTVAGVPVGASVGEAVGAGTIGGLPAGLATSLFSGLGGFAFPAAAVALPALGLATRGSRDNLKARIGFNESGRPTVVDADAKGDLTSADADVLGRQAVLALDNVRRELGAEFNTDVGDFGTIGGVPGKFVVTDASIFKNKANPAGLLGQFSTIEDAQDAFVIGALRSGVLTGDQKKIDAKIRELAPVFKREGLIAENNAPDLGLPGDPQQFRPALNPFLEAIRQTDDPASALVSQRLPPPQVLPEGVLRAGI